MSIVDANFRFYSVPEAARELVLTDGRIRQLLLAGELHGHKLGGSDRQNWAIPAEEIERIKAERAQRAKTAKHDQAKT